MRHRALLTRCLTALPGNGACCSAPRGAELTEFCLFADAAGLPQGAQGSGAALEGVAVRTHCPHHGCL